MQSQITKQEKSANNMSVYFRNLTANINSLVGIKKPNMTENDKFYEVYSPENTKLIPREDIYLDSKFNIQMLETIAPLLNLFPLLKGMGLHIENED